MVRYNPARWKRAQQVMRENAVRILDESAIELQAEIQKRLNQGASRRGATPSAPGSSPHKDTGTLARSIQIDRSGLADMRRPHVRVGTNLVYARILEFGGVIRAKGKLLTVPVTQAARDLLRRGTARSADLHVVPRKGKSPLLRDKSGNVVIVLKRAVRILPRPYMRPAFNKIRPRMLKKFTRGRLLRGL